MVSLVHGADKSQWPSEEDQYPKPRLTFHACTRRIDLVFQAGLPHLDFCGLCRQRLKLLGIIPARQFLLTDFILAMAIHIREGVQSSMFCSMSSTKHHTSTATLGHSPDLHLKLPRQGTLFSLDT